MAFLRPICLFSFLTKENLELEERTTSWALTHNLIYIDNPVGRWLSSNHHDHIDCGEDNDDQVIMIIWSTFPDLLVNGYNWFWCVIIVNHNSWWKGRWSSVHHEDHCDNKTMMIFCVSGTGFSFTKGGFAENETAVGLCVIVILQIHCHCHTRNINTNTKANKI